MRSASSYWYSRRGQRVYQAFPDHWTIHPDEDELLTLLREKRAVALRYSTAFDAPLGLASYHMVFERPTYGFSDVGSKTRSQVRRGLKNCAVEPIEFERIAQEGWPLHCDTLGRQGRQLRLSVQDWRRRWLAAAELPGFEAWGALIHGRLVASEITFQMDDWCYFVYQQCHREFLRAKIPNALTFAVTERIVGRPGIRAIFCGMHSLDAPTSVDEFKLLMGFTAKPVRQRIIFHPWLRPVINRASHALVKYVKKRRPSDPVISKAEGMIRFYLDGKRPIQQQTLPEQLRKPAIDLPVPPTATYLQNE